MEQDWGKEPWVFGEHGELYKETPIHCHIKDAEGNFITSSDRRTFLPGYNWPRIVACINACKDIPTECLERVEQGKSSIIIADEVLNGQRSHFVMPESTIT